MHGDVDFDDFKERRISALLIDKRLFEVENRVTLIEADIRRFPEVVETKLRERAVEERESSESMRDLRMRRFTLAFAGIGASAAIVAGCAELWKVVHG